ncbi:outer membrane beta-barrel protein [Marinoscillum sp. 108]|uniref:outer membrane beta-barrel protein n=1 Tax=Marinoscillum sp. 108 TaxID=2653151 RepID=UPI0012F13175|nr:outer membrane beta-barrel protein [Marinoscillum sp. 108]VXD11164.1 conserved hypothetical protein [Marinoscillum sp. 108]
MENLLDLVDKRTLTTVVVKQDVRFNLSIMTQKQLLLIILFSIASVRVLTAQSLNFVGRGNLSIGAEYQSIDYNGGDLFYSPGGGIGVELGLQLDIVKGFAIQSTLGYQLHLALQAESVNGVSNKSSFNFNRKFISLGVLKNFKLTDKTVNSLQVGTGASINFPGTLKRTENDNELGESSYHSNFGLYFELALRLKLSDKVYLDPAIRYRRLNFSAESYSNGPITDLPDYLQDLNSNGIELGITFVKKLKSSKR